jgi:prevent-host-death family protein
MKPSQDIKPVTFMKTRSAELIDTVTKKGTPIVITQNGEAKVVVQDIRSFERDREALLLLKLLSQGVAEAEKGEGIDQETFFGRLEKRLAPRAR